MRIPSVSWPSPLVSLAPPGLDFLSVEGKLEIYGPTGSHKDREVALILPAAMEQGYTKVGCSSTGNLAQALASACQLSPLQCELWLSAATEKSRVQELQEMGALVHLVEAGYAEAVRIGNLEMARRGIFNGNPSECAEKSRASQALGAEILHQSKATHLYARPITEAWH